MTIKGEEKTIDSLYRGNKRRHEMLKSIRRADDPVVEPEEPEEPEELGDPDPITTNPEESQDPLKQNEDLIVTDDEGDYVTIVVDGEEQQVPRDKIFDAGKRTLQKESAADRRLQEASRRLKEIELREAKLKHLESEGSRKKNSDPPSDDPDEVQLKRAKELLTSILDGDDEKAAKELAKAIYGRRETTPAFNQEDVVAQVELELEERLSRKEARNRFASEYPEIQNSERLLVMADQEAARVHAEHPEYTFEEILMEAGMRVETFLNDVRGGQSKQESANSLGAKHERKRNSSNLRGASVRQKPASPPKPKTRSEIVAEKKARRAQRY